MQPPAQLEVSSASSAISSSLLHHSRPISRSLAWKLMHSAASSRLSPSSLIKASAASPKNECRMSRNRQRPTPALFARQKPTRTSARLRQLHEPSYYVPRLLEQEPAVRVDVDQVKLLKHLHLVSSPVALSAEGHPHPSSRQSRSCSTCRHSCCSARGSRPRRAGRRRRA